MITFNLNHDSIQAIENETCIGRFRYDVEDTTVERLIFQKEVSVETISRILDQWLLQREMRTIVSNMDYRFVEVSGINAELYEIKSLDDKFVIACHGGIIATFKPSTSIDHVGHYDIEHCPIGEIANFFTGDIVHGSVADDLLSLIRGHFGSGSCIIDGRLISCDTAVEQKPILEETTMTSRMMGEWVIHNGVGVQERVGRMFESMNENGDNIVTFVVEHPYCKASTLEVVSRLYREATSQQCELSAYTIESNVIRCKVVPALPYLDFTYDDELFSVGHIGEKEASYTLMLNAPRPGIEYMVDWENYVAMPLSVIGNNREIQRGSCNVNVLLWNGVTVSGYLTHMHTLIVHSIPDIPSVKLAGVSMTMFNSAFVPMLQTADIWGDVVANTTAPNYEQLCDDIRSNIQRSRRIYRGSSRSRLTSDRGSRRDHDVDDRDDSRRSSGRSREGR